MKTKFLSFCIALFLIASIGAQDNKKDFNFGLNGQEEIDPSLQKNFTIIGTSHVYDLNPHTASYSSEAQVLTNVYEGLFSYHPATLEPQYALASAYRISRDKLRWTFTLRENLRFSDGFPLVASDVRDAWLNLLAEKNAPYASLFDIIQGAAEYRTGKGSRSDVAIKAINDTTLSITLVSPASYLPRILCHNAFAVCKKNLNVFSGAYCIKSNKEGTLILEKNK
ncbi:MAG: hypothetical protein IJR49_02635, partial [Treponema sp.]|nr:hypothetical protein [Treponema sp.]